MKTSVDKAARTMWVVTALRYILLVLGTRSWVFYRFFTGCDGWESGGVESKVFPRRAE